MKKQIAKWYDSFFVCNYVLVSVCPETSTTGIVVGEGNYGTISIYTVYMSIALKLKMIFLFIIREDNEITWKSWEPLSPWPTSHEN